MFTKKFIEQKSLPYDAFMSENCIFGYNPQNIKITNTFQNFWNVYSQDAHSHRDQPLLSYFYYKHNITPIFKPFRTLQKNCHTTKKGFSNHTYC